MLDVNDLVFPCVWKKQNLDNNGYGVKILKSEKDLEDLPECEFIIEKMIPFEKELATTIARNERGEIEIFPIVEMMFNEISNQVEFVYVLLKLMKFLLKKQNKSH